MLSVSSARVVAVSMSVALESTNAAFSGGVANEMVPAKNSGSAASEMRAALYRAGLRVACLLPSGVSSALRKVWPRSVR